MGPAPPATREEARAALNATAKALRERHGLPAVRPLRDGLSLMSALAAGWAKDGLERVEPKRLLDACAESPAEADAWAHDAKARLSLDLEDTAPRERGAYVGELTEMAVREAEREVCEEGRLPRCVDLETARVLCAEDLPREGPGALSGLDSGGDAGCWSVLTADGHDLVVVVGMDDDVTFGLASGPGHDEEGGDLHVMGPGHAEAVRATLAGKGWDENDRGDAHRWGGTGGARRLHGDLPNQRSGVAYEHGMQTGEGAPGGTRAKPSEPRPAPATSPKKAQSI